MNILVTGGAGYIGAHCCMELAARGFRPVVFDSLVKGHRENVRWGEFYQGNTGNAGDLADCLARFRIDAVMHFAASSRWGNPWPTRRRITGTMWPARSS